MSNVKHKSKKIIALDKNKVKPEELSSNEHGGLWPFKVDLQVELFRGADPITYTIFLRAPDVNAAQYVAQLTFDYYEHEKCNNPNEYPDISSKYKSSLIGLSEQEYKEFWAEAKHYPHYYGGHKENPSFFHYMKNAKTALASNLIMPNKTQVDIINKTVIKKKV